MQWCSLQQRTTSKCWTIQRAHAVACRSLIWCFVCKWDQRDSFLLIHSPWTCIWHTCLVSVIKPRKVVLSVLPWWQWLTLHVVVFKGSGGYSSRSRTGRDKYGPPVRTEYRLVVENLSSRCSWQDLKVHTFLNTNLCFQEFLHHLKATSVWSLFPPLYTLVVFCLSGLHASGRGSDICWCP